MQGPGFHYQYYREGREERGERWGGGRRGGREEGRRKEGNPLALMRSVKQAREGRLWELLPSKKSPKFMAWGLSTMWSQKRPGWKASVEYDALSLKRDLETTQVREVDECKTWDETIQGMCSECRRLKDTYPMAGLQQCVTESSRLPYLKWLMQFGGCVALSHSVNEFKH